MSAMAPDAHTFDDSAAYERFMGMWSRAAAPTFLDWIAAPPGARWLDVGCGTGILSQQVIATRAPRAVCGVDPARSQVEEAAARAPDGARFQVAEAEALPFRDASFDVVASALVINFMRDAARALAEMRRVARSGGIVAGFVWDFVAEQSPSGPMRRGLAAAGIAIPEIPGTPRSTPTALRMLFKAAGLRDIEMRTIEVTCSFADFDDFWHAQTPGYSPSTRVIARLDAVALARAKRSVSAEVRPRADGTIAYSARANAIKAVAY